jgi:hypothetical protein
MSVPVKKFGENRLVLDNMARLIASKANNFAIEDLVRRFDIGIATRPQRYEFAILKAEDTINKKEDDECLNLLIEATKNAIDANLGKFVDDTLSKDAVESTVNQTCNRLLQIIIDYDKRKVTEAEARISKVENSSSSYYCIAVKNELSDLRDMLAKIVHFLGRIEYLDGDYSSALKMTKEAHSLWSQCVNGKDDRLSSKNSIFQIKSLVARKRSCRQFVSNSVKSLMKEERSSIKIHMWLVSFRALNAISDFFH